jgi:hypothetical protein
VRYSDFSGGWTGACVNIRFALANARCSPTVRAGCSGAAAAAVDTFCGVVSGGSVKATPGTARGDAGCDSIPHQGWLGHVAGRRAIAARLSIGQGAIVPIPVGESVIVQRPQAA